MQIDNRRAAITNTCNRGTLLFVADFIHGSQEILDFACDLAARQSANLQFLHVIDLEHTHSSPDAQMGTQFGLDELAQRARTLKRSAVSLLSFGCPEVVIAKRAAEVNASLVVLPLIDSPGSPDSPADQLQKKLARRLRGKCDCPVLAVSRDLFKEANVPILSIRGLLSFIREACDGERQSMRSLARTSNQVRPQAPLLIMPKSAYFLRK
jgi:hypothetical protein